MSYVHKEDTHNLNAPGEIVPVIISLINPKSVVDIGCGVGTFLHIFKEHGITDLKGLDGEWVNMNLLEKYLSANEFSKENLSEFVDVKRKYDLAICLEVAEHIEEVNANQLIKTLTNASDIILFSAAIPFQSGQFHVNEQWPSYWKEKFNQVGYELFDAIRHQFWQYQFSEFWYKQNMFFAVRKDVVSNYPFLSIHPAHSPLNIVHPDLFIKNSRLLHHIETGKQPIGFYLKLLIKSMLVKCGLIKR